LYVFRDAVAIDVRSERGPSTSKIDSSPFIGRQARLNPPSRKKLARSCPFHLYGLPADMDPILEIARRPPPHPPPPAPISWYVSRRRGASAGCRISRDGLPAASAISGCFTSFYPTKIWAPRGKGHGYHQHPVVRDRYNVWLRSWGESGGIILGFSSATIYRRAGNPGGEFCA